MMSKLTVQDDQQNKHLSLRYTKVREEDRQEISMTDVTEIIKIDIDQIAEIGEFHLVIEYTVDRITQIGQGMNRTIGMTLKEVNFRGNLRPNQMYRGQNYRGGYRRNYRNKNYKRGRSRSRERQYLENTRRNDRISSSRSRSGSRASTNRDRIRCYKCKEYYHFVKDCLTSE